MTYGGGKVPLVPVRHELAVVVDKRSLAEAVAEEDLLVMTHHCQKPRASMVGWRMG
jgi:hypothetical protein